MHAPSSSRVSTSTKTTTKETYYQTLLSLLLFFGYVLIKVVVSRLFLVVLSFLAMRIKKRARAHSR